VGLGGQNVYLQMIDDDFESAEEIMEFLAAWEAAIHPELDGEPILRVALLHADRVPVTHRRVEGVSDEVLAAYWEEERYQELSLEDLVARHGGIIHETRSVAVLLAMTRADDGGYRVSELDSAGARTGFDACYETLEEALYMSALTYGDPPGTITWKELSPGRKQRKTAEGAGSG